MFYFSVSACQIVFLFDIDDLAAIKENINELEFSFNRNFYFPKIILTESSPN